MSRRTTAPQPFREVKDWECGEVSLVTVSGNKRRAQCELPADHHTAPTRPAEPEHMGRDRAGLWHTWPATQASKDLLAAIECAGVTTASEAALPGNVYTEAVQAAIAHHAAVA